MAKYVKMAKVQMNHIVDIVHGEFGKTLCGRDFKLEYSILSDDAEDICRQCSKVQSTQHQKVR